MLCVYDIDKIHKRYAETDILIVEKRRVNGSGKILKIIESAYKSDKSILQKILRDIFLIEEKALFTGEQLKELVARLDDEIGTSSVWVSAKKDIENIFFDLSRTEINTIARITGEKIGFDVAFKLQLQDFPEKILNNFAEGTRANIVNNLTKLEEVGVLDVNEITENILKKYETQIYRARTTARTSASSVAGIARENGYKQSTIITHKQWVTVGDERVRPVHANQDGEVVRKDSTFSNGNTYGGEEYNCRCVEVGIDGEDVVQNADGTFLLTSNSLR